ncbi:hypothetical protein L596_029037 [Steinernema carpocapsae]|uniref:Thiolase N-terminal domain-containing protein n=1 Tax=Steinernema carpocapsae TaxID=34508 RepID=A0A4U5LTF8_STECR|nr:hypothetical protein L596_029037 [Steinernema carpocapsae]
MPSTVEISDVFIVSAARTPIASFRGSFATLSSVDLGQVAVTEALNRAGLKPEAVDETIVGSVLPAGQGQNIARQIAIKSGIPNSSLAFTINKVCSSGLKAVMLASQAIQVGGRQVVVAAGAESMTQTPFYMPRTELVYGDVKMTDGIQKDGLTDAMLGQAMGVCAEKTVKDYKLTRKDQDKYAIQSYHRAAEAWKSGAMKEEVVPVSVKQRRGADIVIAEDEEYKKLVEAKVPSLQPAFVRDGTGTITAANASSINDGAAALVLASEGFLKANEAAKPLAKIVGFAEAGCAPVDFTIAPVKAVKDLLKKTGVSKDQVAKWEVNEAFAVTILSFIRDLELDGEKVNVRGGAVALGHPIGMSGARIVVTLVHQLKEGEFGVAAICNGGGEATAILVQRCAEAGKTRAEPDEDAGKKTPERKLCKNLSEADLLSPASKVIAEKFSKPCVSQKQQEDARKIYEKKLPEKDVGVVRKKAERALLHGYDCRCCAKYYESLNLTPESKKRRINEVSRHRGVEELPSTPPRYWDVHLPRTPEQRRLGWIEETDSPLVKTKKKKRSSRKLF